MDIVFNHSVGLTAIRNGNPIRLTFGCQEKIANVAFSEPHSSLSVDHRSHHDLTLVDGTILKAVPVTAYRTEFPSHAEAKSRQSNKTKTSTSK